MNRNAESLRGAVDRYYAWNLAVFRMEKGKRILDLGSGPCFYLREILSYAPEFYLATDYSANYVNVAETLLEGRENCSSGHLDLLSDEIPPPIASGTFDYVFCFDVLEHLAEDERALKNIHRILEATGHGQLLLRVPALQRLYGKNDEAIGHYRRYSAKGLKGLLEKCSFQVRLIRYQNILGILPWFVIGKVMKRTLAVSRGEGKLFNLLVPFLRWAEERIPPPIGLSLYAVCSLKD